MMRGLTFDESMGKAIEQRVTSAEPLARLAAPPRGAELSAPLCAKAAAGAVRVSRWAARCARARSRSASSWTLSPLGGGGPRAG